MSALDEFLLSDRAPEQCMMLSDLDGFLTGIVVGPEFLPPSEWLPAIWGSEEPVFGDAAHAQSIIGAIMSRCLWDITVKQKSPRPDLQINARVRRRGLIDNFHQQLLIASEHAVAINGLTPRLVRTLSIRPNSARP